MRGGPIRGGLIRAGLARSAPLLQSPRYEVFPAASIEQAVVDWVPRELTVTVTASPAKGLAATLDLTERLAGHGYRVVPHLSARLVRDDAHLADIVARLTGCGVDDVFVPAGDADPPAPVRQRAAAARQAHRDGQAVRAGRDHRLPGEPPEDRRRHHDPGDVGQAAARHLPGQQPLLRPGDAAAVDQPGPGQGRHAAAVRRAGRPGRAGQAAADGGQGWRRRVGQVRWPGTPSGSCASARPAGTARTGCSSEPGPRSPPRHQPWLDCISSRSTRSGRPRSGAARCSTGCTTGP